jgi:muramoyltetrapeptide carboxypeptidase
MVSSMKTMNHDTPLTSESVNTHLLSHGNSTKSTTRQISKTEFLLTVALLLCIITCLSIALVAVIIYFVKQPQQDNHTLTLLKPKRLPLQNSTFNAASVVIGFFSPGFCLLDLIPNKTAYIQRVNREMRSQFNFEPIFSANSFNRDGYLAGTDAERSEDINTLIANTSVQVMMANRGGWGCNRILLMIDYDLASKNPKVIMGFSDVTSCLNAIFFTTGLVTFHGPMGVESFVDNYPGVNYNLNTLYMKKLLLNNEKVLFQNPITNSTKTIKSGKARGRLVGGNLTVFVSMLGSNYLPPKSKINLAWEEIILFFEDVSEPAYHIDRYLTQLSLSGILDKVAGFVFGTCHECTSPPGTQNIEDLIRFHVRKRPAFMGSAFGHDGQLFTFPIGVQVEIDADKGTIQMLENAFEE